MTEATKFVIEKGIPVVDIGRRSARAHKYPWREMEVGDSFMVPDLPENKNARGVYKVAQAIYYFCRHNPQKFTTRNVEGGMRVWRIK